jgi:hypothetical protein
MPVTFTNSTGRRGARFLTLAAVAAAGGCAKPPPPVVRPAVDAEQVALALEERTALRDPIRVVFSWQLNEAGVRVKGRGVARIEPPYKARLDLFLDNGETVVRAALVDGDLRLPPGAPTNILPPPDLMWGVLGVFRPGRATDLVGGDHLADGGVRLRYRYGDGKELDFNVVDGQVHALELLDGGGHVAERVEVGMGASDRYPEEATYRNLSAFRELKLSRESLERVEPYPPDIWNPNGAGR